MESTWVPEHQRDTRWYIWHKLFQCRVPFIQTMSVDYIQHFGMPSSGDTMYDRQTANELITRMLTIAQMIEFFAQGVTVRVCRVEDTKLIYEHITDHLNAWKKELNESLNIRNAPIDELILMDKFANAVYAHAKYQFTAEIADSYLTRKMMSAVRVNRDNLFTKKPTSTTVIRPIEETGNSTPSRVSMAEVFASRAAAARGGKWK